MTTNTQGKELEHDKTCCRLIMQEAERKLRPEENEPVSAKL